MKCVFINDVKFSQDSVNAIKDIRRRGEMAVALSRVMPAGVMLNIFLGNKPLHSAYNISQADFEALAKAMGSLPAIQRKVIRDIATMQALSHSGKESQFWRGVTNGCKIQ